MEGISVSPLHLPTYTQNNVWCWLYSKRNIWVVVLTRPNCVRPLCSGVFPGTSALEQSALKRERDLTVRQIDININSLLVKCYNDYLNIQSCGRGEVVFCFQIFYWFTSDSTLAWTAIFDYDISDLLNNGNLYLQRLPEILSVLCLVIFVTDTNLSLVGTCMHIAFVSGIFLNKITKMSCRKFCCLWNKKYGVPKFNWIKRIQIKLFENLPFWI